MLVLTRKPGETIMIDDHIEITIVQIKDDKVRVGLVVPKEIPVHHKESGDVWKSDPEVLKVEELARELEKSRQESLKYKNMLQDLLRAEWKPVQQADLDTARQSTFDAVALLAELQQGSAA